MHRPPLPQEKSLVLIFRGWVDPRAHGSVGGSQGKNPQWPPGIDPGTVRLVAQCLNHYATPGPHCCLSCSIIYYCYIQLLGHTAALQSVRSGVRSPMLPLEFLIDQILLAALWPWGRLSLQNRNEYQGYFLGGKGGRCSGLTTLSLSFADCLEIWKP